MKGPRVNKLVATFLFFVGSTVSAPTNCAAELPTENIEVVESDQFVYFAINSKQGRSYKLTDDTGTWLYIPKNALHDTLPENQNNSLSAFIFYKIDRGKIDPELWKIHNTTDDPTRDSMIVFPEGSYVQVDAHGQELKTQQETDTENLIQESERYVSVTRRNQQQWIPLSTLNSKPAPKKQHPITHQPSSDTTDSRTEYTDPDNCCCCLCCCLLDLLTLPDTQEFQDYKDDRLLAY